MKPELLVGLGIPLEITDIIDYVNTTSHKLNDLRLICPTELS